MEDGDTKKGETLPRSQYKRGWRTCPLCKWNNFHSFLNNTIHGSTCPLQGTKAAGAWTPTPGVSDLLPQTRSSEDQAAHRQSHLLVSLIPTPFLQAPSHPLHLLCPSPGPLQLHCPLPDSLPCRQALAPSSGPHTALPFAAAFPLPHCDLMISIWIWLPHGQFGREREGGVLIHPRRFLNVCGMNK